jgi:ectoine hydroxylase-related dioxygenase (phytanoyl-CoA dioxygenase family)
MSNLAFKTDGSQQDVVRQNSGRLLATGYDTDVRICCHRIFLEFPYTMSRDLPLVESSADEQPEALRERFQEFGYLYLGNALSAEKCQALLQDILACLSPHVVSHPQGQAPILQGEPFFETDVIWDEVYPRMQSLHTFHNFFHEEDVQRLMRLLAGDEVFVYPMKMGRIATPRKIGYETPPHQDAHSHQAGPTMAGIWVALHDVSEGMGRLKLLPGSHKRGVRKVFQAEGVGGVQCEIFPEEDVWHVSDVKQGDVIIFHSCCVHRAEPNTTRDTVRISIDTRFCDYGAPVFVTNLEPHHGWRIDGLDWQSIYQDWENPGLQHYWRDYPAVFDQLMH